MIKIINRKTLFISLAALLTLFIPPLLFADTYSLSTIDPVTGNPIQAGDFVSAGNIVAQSPCIINAGKTVNFIATGTVTLKPGFHAQAGCSFDAKAGNVYDSDYDAMADWWELKYFGNLSEGAKGDADNDDLNNLAEFKNGAKPDTNDTDNDGMEDGWEVANNLNPLDEGDASLDPDEDGMTNADEYAQGSDPQNDINSIPGEEDIVLPETPGAGYYITKHNIYSHPVNCVVNKNVNNENQTVVCVLDRNYQKDQNGQYVLDANGKKIQIPNRVVIRPGFHVKPGNIFAVSVGSPSEIPKWFNLDNDNLPDWWELSNFQNSLIWGGWDDPDQDRFVNLLEYMYSTNPNSNLDRPPRKMVYEYDSKGRIKTIVRMR